MIDGGYRLDLEISKTTLSLVTCQKTYMTCFRMTIQRPCLGLNGHCCIKMICPMIRKPSWGPWSGNAVPAELPDCSGVSYTKTARSELTIFQTSLHA